MISIALLVQTKVDNVLSISPAEILSLTFWCVCLQTHVYKISCREMKLVSGGHYTELVLDVVLFRTQSVNFQQGTHAEKKNW